MTRPDDLLLQPGLRAHLVGCGGAGLRALAEFGTDLGWRVTGSDAGVAPRVAEALLASGIRVHAGHSPGHLPADAELMVHSPAVPPQNVERLAAGERGLPDFSYPEVLGAISRRWPTVAVAGTHGKSTTTGLVASALTGAGRARAVLCGAEVLSRRRHGWSGDGDWAVIEACEYRRHFLELTPEIAVVLAIEPDHFDCYPELESAVQAYRQFVQQVRPGGLALLNIDAPASQAAWQDPGGAPRTETMSATGLAADWQATAIEQAADRLSLEIAYRGRAEGAVSLRAIGVHHAANLLAAFAVLRTVGVDAPQTSELLANFGGLGRRLERHADWRGIVRYDDYAHHPTAVRAVLTALRGTLDGNGRRRLVCAFQPHQISRTERLAEDFGRALSVSDEVWVLPVYAAREGSQERAAQLAGEVARFVSPPSRAQVLPSLDHAVVTLETALRPGDVFVTLGAGDIDCLHYELPRRFP